MSQLSLDSLKKIYYVFRYKIMSPVFKKIYEGALHEFSHSGYEKTTIDSISTRGGVGRSSIYSHFNSKAEIAEHIIRDLSSKLIGELSSIQVTPDGAYKLEHFIANRCLNFYFKNSAHMALYRLTLEIWNDKECAARCYRWVKYANREMEKQIARILMNSGNYHVGVLSITTKGILRHVYGELYFHVQNQYRQDFEEVESALG